MKNQITIREAITEADIGHRLCAAGDLHLGGREMLHFGVLRFPGVPG